MKELIIYRMLLKFIMLLSAIITVSCGSGQIDRDRPRQVLTFNYPNGFEPSYITTDEDGTRWGLLVSRRYSGKDNLWAVKSENGGEWSEPILLMNAYYFEELEFEVRNDTFRLAFDGIDDGYFYDYNLFLDDTLPFPEKVTVELAMTDLTADEDGDALPNVMENELLLSTRMPDSDTDDKNDDVDFCPLARPCKHSDRFDIYRSAIMYLMRFDNPASLQPRQDTAWSKYYNIY